MKTIRISTDTEDKLNELLEDGVYPPLDLMEPQDQINHLVKYVIRELQIASPKRQIENFKHIAAGDLSHRLFKEKDKRESALPEK